MSEPLNKGVNDINDNHIKLRFLSKDENDSMSNFINYKVEVINVVAGPI